MACSYSHVTHGWSLIENMGDAHEAVEELLWLVRRTMSDAEARALLDKEFHPIVRGEKEPDEAYVFVEKVMSL